jgi:hypothetical protein
MALVSVATAYIVFAPDSWPKPFYLMYEITDPAEEEALQKAHLPKQNLLKPPPAADRSI